MSYLKNIRRVTPYIPGEQPRDVSDLIKLNTNECPYPPSGRVRMAIEGCASSYDALRLYPDPDASALTEAIADYHGVSPAQVFTGVGSDDVLSLAFLTFFHSDRQILFPDITYSFYDVWARMYEIPFKTIPLDEDFLIDPEGYQSENGGIVIANPNAPTGIAEDRSFIGDIASAHPDSIVIADEAYVDFAPEGTSALPLVDDYDNLLVVRTFSKSRALAGMRIGYAVGPKELIGFLKDVKASVNSYTMSRVAIAAGVASITDDAYFKETVAKIIATRTRLEQSLFALDFETLPSGGNFVFAKHGSIPGKEIFRKLREQGIYVRRFDAPRIAEYLRITIGTDDETDRLIEALSKMVS